MSLFWLPWRDGGDNDSKWCGLAPLLFIPSVLITGLPSAFCQQRIWRRLSQPLPSWHYPHHGCAILLAQQTWGDYLPHFEEGLFSSREMAAGKMSILGMGLCWPDIMILLNLLVCWMQFKWFYYIICSMYIGKVKAIMLKNNDLHQTFEICLMAYFRPH